MRAVVVPQQRLLVTTPLASAEAFEKIMRRDRMMRALPKMLLLGHVVAARTSAYIIIVQRKSRPMNFICTRSRRAP